jgi:hypothetical protein
MLRKLTSVAGHRYATVKEDGTPCCQGDDPKLLCAACLVRVEVDRIASGPARPVVRRTVMTKTTTRTAAGAVPQPRDLNAIFRARVRRAAGHDDDVSTTPSSVLLEPESVAEALARQNERFRQRLQAR